MDSKPMKILIIEDDVEDCKKFLECAKERKDIEIVAITDSDIEGLKLVKLKRPEGIILDLELNNSTSGNPDSLGFMPELRKLNLNYEPIVIVTTHVYSKRTYEILHRNEVDLILCKHQANYSVNHVFNSFFNYRKTDVIKTVSSIEEDMKDRETRISNYIDDELELVGITSKLKGRQYIHDAIFYLIQNDGKDVNVIQHLTNLYKKSPTTISNGMQNAIIRGWRISSVDDLLKYYKAKINHETGIPTTMELIYYYRDKIKKMI